MSYASCCVLSYERPRFLAECLESLMAAGGSKFELIVHDDGSRDAGVPTILHTAHELGATIVQGPRGHNMGQGVALNRMFAIATGDPICKIDQDLIFEPGWLDTVCAFLAENARIGLLSGYRYEHKPCDWRDTLLAERESPAGRWQEHEYVMGSFMAIRRRCWEELGPFEQGSRAFAEDHVFQRKVTDSGTWVCGTPVVPLMRNQGYGIGPSTVVTADGSVQSIHTEARVL